MSGGQTEKQVQLIRLPADIIMVTPSYMLNIADEIPRRASTREHQTAHRHLRRRALDRRHARRDRGAFGIDAIDIYGLSEVIGPGVANECAETKDGPVIWEDHFYPEIIDPNTGEVLPDGRTGRTGIHLADQGGDAGDPLPHPRPDPPAAADRPQRCGASARSPAAPTTC
jgi:phenylacetate-CoA ligase